MRVSAAVICALAICACGPSAGFKEPPAGSFVQQTHLVKTDVKTASMPGAAVSKEFFAGTDARPLLGRYFLDADFTPIARSTVVLSNQLWTEGFAAAPSIIGRETQIDDHRATIVGVAPKGFDFPAGAQFWIARR